MKKIECRNIKKVIRFALVALAITIVSPYYEGAAEPPADPHLILKEVLDGSWTFPSPKAVE